MGLVLFIPLKNNNNNNNNKKPDSYPAPLGLKLGNARAIERGEIAT